MSIFLTMDTRREWEKRENLRLFPARVLAGPKEIHAIATPGAQKFSATENLVFKQVEVRRKKKNQHTCDPFANGLFYDTLIIGRCEIRNAPRES